MNLSSTGEMNTTVVKNKFALENDRSLLNRYGKDVFAYLDVIRLVAAEKIDIYKADVHKKIFLRSLFSQLYDSLCRHISEEEDGEGQSFDKKSAEGTIHKAMETDNRLFADFKLDFDFDDTIVRVPKTIDRTPDQTYQFDQSHSMLNTTSDRILRPRNNRISYKDLHNGTLNKTIRR